MPIRISTVSAAPELGLHTEADWQSRIADLRDALATALEAGDAAGVAAAFAGARELPHPQRAYQATIALCERFFAHRQPQDAGTVEMYATALAALLDVLAETPAEPVLLNLAGVLLAELHQPRQARELLRAALRLDPELALARRNLAAIARLPQTSLSGRLGNRLRALAARASQVAKRARPAQGMTLSLVMIVRDEEEMLPGCLEPLAPVVDEIVVVDTGSSDRTREIAASFGARVIDFPWSSSFADARNASLDAATGDWVMYVDADEHLVPEDAAQLRDLLGKTWREAFYVVETNYTGGDESGAAVAHSALRIWRNRPEYRFEGRIHEQITPSMPTYLPERFEVTQVRLRHFGYLKSRINARGKSQRNIELLEREARESPTPFTWYNLGSEHLALGDARRARSYLDRAWNAVRTEPDWHQRGYAPLLTRRTVTARRESGDLEAAREAIREGLAVYPRHTDLLFELALTERADGKLDEAIRLAERCLEQGDSPPHLSGTVGSGSFLALSLLGDIHVERGDHAAAEAFYRRSLAEHPDYVAPVLPLAATMLRRGAKPEEVAELVPDRPSATLLAATAFYEEGHTALAEEWFRRVLARQPSSPVARIGLVEALLAQSRFAEAAEEAAREPDDSPLAGAARAAELFAYAALGDEERLAAALAGVSLPLPQRELYSAWRAALAGEALPAWLPPACAADAERCLEALLRVQAFDAFQTAVSVFERIGLPERERRERLARIYFRRGYLDSAADEWLAVARETPDAAALIGLAQVAHARGLAEDAEVFAREAARLEPANETARRLLAGLEARAA